MLDTPKKRKPTKSSGTVKNSYTIPCSFSFREEINALANRKEVNAGDLVRSVILTFPHEVIAAFPDTGAPGAKDREPVVLKSGDAEGREWKRKPRIQVRIPGKHDVAFLRKALAMAIANDKGEMKLGINQKDKIESEMNQAKEEIERLRAAFAVIAFEPLPNGVRSRQEALYVLGFPPGKTPEMRLLKARFRMLATVYHPDSPLGNHLRMSQVNSAMDILKELADS